MDTGKWLTHSTAWVALWLYVSAALAKAVRPSLAYDRLAGWLHTIGCAALLAHLGCAFEFHHHWSHGAAHAETARQTAQLVGWNWGGGVYVNYAFTLVWLGDVTWYWKRPNSYRARPDWVRWSVRGFFLFMIFNGAFVFVHGARRWFGFLLCVILVGCWWRTRNRSLDSAVQTNRA